MADKPKNGTATSAELQQLRQWLRDHGMSNQDAQNLVKNRTRKTNADAIIADLKNRPKAGKK